MFGDAESEIGGGTLAPVIAGVTSGDVITVPVSIGVMRVQFSVALQQEPTECDASTLEISKSLRWTGVSLPTPEEGILREFVASIACASNSNEASIVLIDAAIDTSAIDSSGLIYISHVLTDADHSSENPLAEFLLKLVVSTGQPGFEILNLGASVGGGVETDLSTDADVAVPN